MELYMTKTYRCMCKRNLSAVTASWRWRNRSIAVIVSCRAWWDHLVVAGAGIASPDYLCAASEAESAVAVAVDVIVTAVSPISVIVVTSFHAWSRSSMSITPIIAVRICVSCHCESCKSESHHCCLHNRIVFRG